MTRTQSSRGIHYPECSTALGTIVRRQSGTRDLRVIFSPSRPRIPTRGSGMVPWRGLQAGGAGFRLQVG